MQLTASEWVGIIAAIFYGLSMTILAVHGLHLYWLLWRWRRTYQAAAEASAAEAARLPADEDLPAVLVQIPVFNERHVVARCVEAIGKLDWPRDRLNIQLLDDSTDDSLEIGAEAIAKLVAEGINASQVTREDRVGYKAGALEHGMTLDESPYIAIFDADFVPEPDFLKRAIVPLLEDDGLALVQGRWEHLNPHANLLTRAQSIGIDGHFGIEQGARAWSGLAMNFNGTGGLWRRQAIIEAGGWEHDTLTEDMDLSYRAQLIGWRCTYRSDIPVPAELPDDLPSFAQQQFRWAKGSIQTAIKLLPRIWRGSWGLETKIAASLHTTHYLVHPLLLMALLMAAPALALSPGVSSGWLMAGFVCFLIGITAPTTMYWTAQRALNRDRKGLIWQFPKLTALGTGVAVSNATACWQALRGQQSAFVRTPKRGDSKGTYRAGTRSGLWELTFAAWSLLGIWIGLEADRPWMAPILLLSSIGLAWVGGSYAKQALIGWWRNRPVDADAKQRRWALAGLGLPLVAGIAVLALLPGDWRGNPGIFGGIALGLSLPWLAAIWLINRRPEDPIHVRRIAALPIILVVAFAIRLLGLGITPSDDVNRYLMEGALLEANVNPYAVALNEPEALAAAEYHSLDPAIIAGLNYPDWSAGYPPGALMVHALGFRIDREAWAMQLLMLIAEGVALIVGIGLLNRLHMRSELIVAWAWCPLVPIFAVGEAHHDAVMMLLAVTGLSLMASGSRVRSLIALSAAALVKPFAVCLLLPRLWRASWLAWLAALAIAVLAYLPFLGAGKGVLESFGRFGTNLAFNGAFEPLVREIVELFVAPERVRKLTVLALIGILMGGSLAILLRAGRDSAGPETAARLAALLLLCLPTIHPWYLLLLVPMLPVMTRSWGLLLWVALAPGYWLHGIAIQANGGVWTEDTLVRSLIHFPAILVLAWEAAGRPKPPRLGLPSRQAKAMLPEA